MCGIAGFIHADRNQPVDAEILVSMAAIQHHRGPDGFGWRAGAGVGLSHARLSIIDLEAERGRQPFLSGDGRLLLAKNGELYDYQRIRAGLSAAGARFATKSDSEIILHLYPRLGLAGMLEQLRGEFAFALHDRDEDTLWLVRDRFGIKPLYYAEYADGLAFGSEIKVLFAHPEVRRAFDSRGLFHQLMQTMVPGTTAFEGVHQVPPGHAIGIRRRDGRLQVRQQRYWDMTFPVAGEHQPVHREASMIEGVRERLVEAVSLRLEADVPVGCYLSGGIDSCSILGLAAALRQDPVKAFTIGFDSAAYDETPIAAGMAAATGAGQIVLRLDAGTLYDAFAETMWHTERTVYNTLAVAKFLMSRRVRESGYKVVLTGEGSDELFGGYPAFRQDMYLHGLDELPAAERQAMEAALATRNARFSGAMLAETAVTSPALDAVVGFTPACLQPWLASATRVPALLDGDRRAALRDHDPGAAIAAALDPTALQGRHPLDKAQYVWIKTMLEGQILTWGGDRVDMAHSMEARPPFLDHPLAAYAATLPPTLRIRGQTDKYVLREAMKGLLPERLYRREKFAFMAPPAHTDPRKVAALQALAAEYLGPTAIDAAGLLDRQGVAAVLALHEAADTSGATRNQIDAIINHLLGVQILHERLIAADVPALAQQQAHALGWSAG